MAALRMSFSTCVEARRDGEERTLRWPSCRKSTRVELFGYWLDFTT